MPQHLRASGPSRCCNSVTRASAVATASLSFSAAARMNLASSSRNSCSTVAMLTPHSFEMLSATFALLKIPEQPIIIGDELAQFAVPFLGQLAVQLLQKWQQ